MNPNHTTYEDQCHSRHRHHTIVDIAEVVAGIGNNLESQQGATTEELTEGADNHKDHCVSKTVSYTIEERRPGLFIIAKASNRPIRIQLVIIRPTYTLS